MVADRKANVTTDAVLKWLDGNYKKKWFLWVHYYDPHREYDPPPPFRQLYYFDEYSGKSPLWTARFKRLLQFLEYNEIKDKTIIIAIADHGEGLGEHGESTHGIIFITAPIISRSWCAFPTEEQGPGSQPVVGQADVMPTSWIFSDLPIPADIQGQSLKKLILGQENDSPPERPLSSPIPLFHFGWSELYGLFTSQYQYIQAPKPELYDLTKDPAEAEKSGGDNPKLIKEFDYKIETDQKILQIEFIEEAKSGVDMTKRPRNNSATWDMPRGTTGWTRKKPRPKIPATIPTSSAS